MTLGEGAKQDPSCWGSGISKHSLFLAKVQLTPNCILDGLGPFLKHGPPGLPPCTGVPPHLFMDLRTNAHALSARWDKVCQGIDYWLRHANNQKIRSH